MPMLSVLIILTSLIIAGIGAVRAIEYPGKRAWLWWELFMLAVVNWVAGGKAFGLLARPAIQSYRFDYGV